MTCERCGFEDDDLEPCGVCRRMVCPACGKTLTNGKRYCTVAGCVAEAEAQTGCEPRIGIMERLAALWRRWGPHGDA